MPPARRIAAMFDADQLTLREREILRGIARYAQDAGWRLALDPFALHHPAAGWDGLLVPPRMGLLPLIARCSVPIVRLNWKQRTSTAGYAVENRYVAGRLAARHLVERGYRSFAYLGFTHDIQSRVERYEFRRALDRLGRSMGAARTRLTFADMRRGWEKVMASLSDWLGCLEPPVGIFVARPGLARALADLALARGLRIPQDLGIIAADNDPVVCELAPALTSIHFDYAEVGTRAAELLDRLIDEQRPASVRVAQPPSAVEAGEDSDTERVAQPPSAVGGHTAGRQLRERPPKGAVLIPPTLVPRHSTDRQAVADPLVAKALYWIDARRTEPISAPDVAAALDVSDRKLQRRFRRAGRLTVEQEIAKARVEHAKIWITEPDVSVRFVAHLCGFGSYPAFWRAFPRHAGMPPSEWRKQAMLRRQGAKEAERMPSSHKGPRGTRRKHDPFGA